MKPNTMANNCRNAFSCWFHTVDCLTLFVIRWFNFGFELDKTFDDVLFRSKLYEDIACCFRLATDDNDEDDIRVVTLFCSTFDCIVPDDVLGEQQPHKWNMFVFVDLLIVSDNEQRRQTLVLRFNNSWDDGREFVVLWLNKFWLRLFEVP